MRSWMGSSMGSWSPPDRAGAERGWGAGRAPARRQLVALQHAGLWLTIALLPLNWVMGTTLLWVFAVLLVALLAPERPSGVEISFAGLSAALLLGLFVAAAAGAAPPDRAIASFYNLAIILLMAMFANMGRKVQGLGEASAGAAGTIYRAAFWCFLAQLAVIVPVKIYVTFALKGTYELEFRTLVMGALGELPGVLKMYSKSAFSMTDWTNKGPESRITGFGVYATEGAILLLLTGLLAMIHVWRRRSRALVVAVEVAIAVALILMASRTTLLAYLLTLPLVGALRGRKVMVLALLASPVILVFAGLLAVYGPELGKTAFAAANESRAGSSDERFRSYMMAIDMVKETNLVTGLGIKPRDESVLSIPIGSHSSFISSFTKGGLVALAALVGVYLVLIGGILRSQAMLYGLTGCGVPPERRFEFVTLSRTLVVLMTWWVTEDFDAPAHQAAIGGLCIGLFWGLLEIGRAGAARAAWHEPRRGRWDTPSQHADC